MSEQRGLQGGVTLVELLVAIVALGILAAGVAFSVGGSNGKGQRATARQDPAAQQHACSAEKAALESAVEAYKAMTTDYPDTIASLTTGSDKVLRDAPSWYTVAPARDGTLAYANDGATRCATVPPNE